MLDQGPLEFVEGELPDLPADQAPAHQPQRAPSQIEVHFADRVFREPPHRAGAHREPQSYARDALPWLQLAGIPGQAERHRERQQATGEQEESEEPECGRPVMQGDLPALSLDAHRANLYRGSPKIMVGMKREATGMRVSPVEYLGLALRAHQLLRGVPLYDVSAVDLPGGGAGMSLADVRRLDRNERPSRVAGVLFGLRRLLGRAFGWDRAPMRVENSFVRRLSERDRRDSEIAPGTLDGPFLLIYQFPGEALREIRNATVHGWISTALVPTRTGYRLYWAVYVLPVSWITRPYLTLIEPFRRVLYPAMLRRIRRAWIAAYKDLPSGSEPGTWEQGKASSPP